MMVCSSGDIMLNIENKPQRQQVHGYITFLLDTDEIVHMELSGLPFSHCELLSKIHWAKRSRSFRLCMDHAGKVSLMCCARGIPGHMRTEYAGTTVAASCCTKFFMLRAASS